MSERERLDALYRRTRYVVLLDAGELVLRIGEADPAADERLRREAGCSRGWALVTPCNPDSRALSAAENSVRLRDGRQALAAMELRHLPAVGRDPDGAWDDEPGFLLVDAPEATGRELGARWEQNAIVTGTLGEPPALVWLVGG
jgi:hypothetical protein